MRRIIHDHYRSVFLRLFLRARWFYFHISRRYFLDVCRGFSDVADYNRLYRPVSRFLEVPSAPLFNDFFSQFFRDYPK